MPQRDPYRAPQHSQAPRTHMQTRTGPIHKPIGFQVYSNGIRIDFTEPVDPETASKTDNYFAQQWNYEHSKSYGSVEYSVFRPHMVGHDRVDIQGVQILDDGKSVFLEIPRIVPCYQMHVRMHLSGEDGTPFKTDIFPTLLSLGERYEFSGAAANVPGRAETLSLRVREYGDVVLRGHNPELKTERTITLNAITGIQYFSVEHTKGRWRLDRQVYLPTLRLQNHRTVDYQLSHAA